MEVTCRCVSGAADGRADERGNPSAGEVGFVRIECGVASANNHLRNLYHQARLDPGIAEILCRRAEEKRGKDVDCIVWVVVELRYRSVTL